jgi:nucleoside-diphosphate-sugar epimerase
MSLDLHVILGTGPAGAWTANALLARGEKVRLVNRSGKRPALVRGEADVVAADVTDAAAAAAAAAGATAVYQALNPPYDKWQELFPGLQAGALAAAKAAGARYVSIDNLYMYDPSAGPMDEDSDVRPRSKKGELRARMAADVLAAHERGDVQAVILRSSDYYGPGVTASALGERIFPPVLAGKPGEALGALDVPHSYCYIEDLGAAAAALGTTADSGALGRVWITPHAPAATQREVLTEVFREAGGAPRFKVVGPRVLRFAALFSRTTREVAEMLYEFTEPFTVDSRRMERAFALRPTPRDEGLARTVAWYRAAGTGK